MKRNTSENVYPFESFHRVITMNIFPLISFTEQRSLNRSGKELGDTSLKNEFTLLCIHKSQDITHFNGSSQSFNAYLSTKPRSFIHISHRNKWSRIYQQVCAYTRSFCAKIRISRKVFLLNLPPTSIILFCLENNPETILSEGGAESAQMQRGDIYTSDNDISGVGLRQK